MKNKFTLLLITIAIFLSSIYVYNRNNSGTVYTFSENIENIDTGIYADLYEKDGLIIVDISGEVNIQGTYVIENGSTLSDLISLAGGTTQNSDTSILNFDEVLKDKQSIVIPTIYNIDSNGQNENNEQDNNMELININTASKEILKTLPGIGDTIADSIIRYRENTPFKSISDIKNVDRIGEKTYEKIKDLITI